MRKRKLQHLPEHLWPPDDHLLFEAAYAPGDIFDDSRGPGAHLADATRTGLHSPSGDGGWASLLSTIRASSTWRLPTASVPSSCAAMSNT
jgi:hypothetical protein